MLPKFENPHLINLWKILMLCRFILCMNYSVFESKLDKFIINFKSLLYFAVVIMSVRFMINLNSWNQVRLRKLCFDWRLKTVEVGNQRKSLHLLFLLLLVKQTMGLVWVERKCALRLCSFVFVVVSSLGLILLGCLRLLLIWSCIILLINCHVLAYYVRTIYCSRWGLCCCQHLLRCFIRFTF